MSHQFAGKVAFVTGAASGIGAAVTRLLLDRGACVVASDVDEEGLSAIAEPADGALLRTHVDVTQESSIKAGVQRAVERFGQLHVAFNVAGVSRGKPLLELDEETWDFNVDRVLKGVYLCTKHEATAMRDNGTGGAIVNMSSLNARVPMHTGSAYASAKAGVEMFSKNAALELAADGIRVNTLLPGLIDTPLTQRRITNLPLMVEWLKLIPLARPGHADEVARASLFLASDDASYITGTSLVVDGGWSITGYPDLRRFT